VRVHLRTSGDGGRRQGERVFIITFHDQSAKSAAEVESPLRSGIKAGIESALLRRDDSERLLVSETEAVRARLIGRSTGGAAIASTGTG